MLKTIKRNRRNIEIKQEVTNVEECLVFSTIPRTFSSIFDESDGLF